MGLTFHQATARATSAANPITTASLTLDTNEKLAVLMIKTVGGTDRSGGAPTFGGQTMTQANSTQKAVSSPEAGCELWYLLDPPTGAQTASIPNEGTLTLYYTVATGKASSTLSGSVVLNGSNGGNATSTNPTPGAIVVTADQALGFAVTAGGWTNFSSATPAGVALSTSDDGAHGGAEQYLNIASGPGSFTLNWTFGTSDDWGAVAAVFSENYRPPAMENYKFPKCASAGIISMSERIR